jgi:hypothetical protein
MLDPSCGSTTEAALVQFNVKRTAETTLQGMGRTATTLGATMLLFGGVACVYASIESISEAYRGQADWKNGAIAGLAAGAGPSRFVLGQSLFSNKHAPVPHDAFHQDLLPGWGSPTSHGSCIACRWMERQGTHFVLQVLLWGCARAAWAQLPRVAFYSVQHQWPWI